MARTRWRTVSCADDSIKAHGGKAGAYRWVADQPAGSRFRVRLDEGYGWETYATVRSNGDGTTDEE